ncbi:hypothetical protein K2Y11_15840, partial [bacterium]|nr:hypothetical protein [bacterium]
MKTEKSLDRKLRALRANPDCGEFIIADAKDADMAFGIGSAGKSPELHAGETRFRSIQEYRDIIREISRQQLVDIMLMSASTSEELTLRERIFDDSPVTPACRANDASDVHVVRGGRYVGQTPRPFRTATLDHIQCGKADCEPGERALGADLGLYSVTFTNNTDDDLYTLERYKEFRLEAERKGFRHFLEVFNPNLAGVVPSDQESGFINDMIARSLAGVTEKGRPVFLKIVYNGPKAMEELVHYDRNIIVGVLGGSSGTTLDAFKLLSEAKKYGARAALFGRKINQAENQFAFIRFLRLIAEGVVSPEEAVKAYHAVLQKLGTKPNRSLEEDLTLQTSVMRYLSSKTTVVMPGNDTGYGGGSGASTSSPWSPPSKTSSEPTSNRQEQSETRPMVRVTMSHSLQPVPFGQRQVANSIASETKKEASCGSKGACHCGCKNKKGGAPDFAQMTSAE